MNDKLTAYNITCLNYKRYAAKTIGAIKKTSTFLRIAAPVYCAGLGDVGAAPQLLPEHPYTPVEGFHVSCAGLDEVGAGPQLSPEHADPLIEAAPGTKGTGWLLMMVALYPPATDSCDGFAGASAGFEGASAGFEGASAGFEGASTGFGRPSAGLEGASTGFGGASTTGFGLLGIAGAPGMGSA